MSMQQRKTVPSTTVEGLGEIVDPALLDVREPAEWATGHIDGARLIPAAQLDPAALPAGRMPGVTSLNRGPSAVRNAGASCAEQTTPSRPLPAAA